MMVVTHTVMSIALTSMAMGSADPLVLGLAAIAAQLPDVDTSKSVPGRILFPVSHWIEQRFPHRSITHSFLATVLFSLMCLPMLVLGVAYWHALILGYFLGWFGDVFTKSGVTAFYPSAARLVIPGNPRLRLSTRSPAELFVLGVLILVMITSITINSSGGILRAFNQVLGMSSGAVEIVNAENSRYLLFAHITGTRQLTSEPVNEDFEVIKSLTQNDLLVKDMQGRLYRAGTTQECQILASEIHVDRGPAIAARIQEVVLSDQTVAEALQGIPLDRTYISGAVTLDSAEDLRLANQPQQFSPITLQTVPWGAVAALESASPNQVIHALGGYVGNGSLVVRSLRVQS
jgi:inner membrane protein